MTPRNHRAVGVVPESTLAGSFVEGLAAQDFAELGGALAADACLRALLPSGLREWAGAEAIARVFARWFGDTEDFELVEASVGEVGGRLHLQWQLRLRPTVHRQWPWSRPASSAAASLRRRRPRCPR